MMPMKSTIIEHHKNQMNHSSDGLAIVHRNLSLLAKALELSRLFSVENLSVMALQGMTVVRAYQHPGLRPMEDIDLLVRPKDMDRARQVLEKSGFRSRPLYPDLLEKEGVLLDVHTHPLNLDRIRSRRFLFPEDVSPLWSRAVPFFDGEAGGLLQPDRWDNFILLSAHALKHSYSLEKWLVDLKIIMAGWREDDADWAELIRRARFWRQERPVLYGLMLVEAMLGERMPRGVLSGLGVEQLTVVEKRILRMKAAGFASDRLCMALWFFMIEGWGRRSRFLWETVFPGRAVMGQVRGRRAESLVAADYLRRGMEAISLASGDMATLFRFELFNKRRQAGVKKKPERPPDAPLS